MKKTVRNRSIAARKPREITAKDDQFAEAAVVEGLGPEKVRKIMAKLRPRHGRMLANLARSGLNRLPSP